MNILICYGTRPEFIKIKPLLLKFKENDVKFKTLFTGQHIDLLSGQETDYKINIQEGDNTNRLDSIIQSNLNLPEEYFKDITHVLVQGDTTSALACALTAFNRKIKIIHLEAGLRTHNINSPFPEEANRQLISRIASINLCPTSNNAQNLINENCPGEIHIVGNTVLDNLKSIKDRVTYENRILITLHRRENHSIIKNYFESINLLAKKFEYIQFIIPLHPNPNVQAHKNVFTSNNIKIENPLKYEDMIEQLRTCKFFISDSGGIQEEACFLNKRVIICRESTEREEGIKSGHNILCPKPEKLEFIFNQLINNYININDCPFGDGNSSEKIIRILLKDNY